MMEQDQEFEALLETLAEAQGPLKAVLIYRLSDLSPADLSILRLRWQFFPVERRRQLLARLAETSETSFDLDFSTVALFALQDEDDEVRRQAIAALWTNEEESTMRELLAILAGDVHSSVQAAAAEALAPFVLAGELGTISAAARVEVEGALLQALSRTDYSDELHRRALESLAFSGHQDLPELIEKAYASPVLDAQASALFAMGRSADERWTPIVARALADDRPEIQYEAARAAGELGMAESVSRLIELSGGPDREVQHAAIWSLGEIGGAQAQRALVDLSRQIADEDLLEAIDDALHSAALAEGSPGPFMLLNESFAGMDDLDAEEDDLDDLYEDD